ncbi:hypothetical protein ACFL3D_00560 [Candidatus Omnitrophota bacterium]
MTLHKRTSTKLVFLLSVVVFILISFSSLGYAQTVPQRINYQGLLTDKAGAPRQGSYTIRVRIYDAETGGTELFLEDHEIEISPNDKGIFNIAIGSSTSLTLTFGVGYWMSIEVFDSAGNSDGEMTPRQRMTSVPYGLNSDRLDTLDSEQFLRSDQDDSMSGNLTIHADVYVQGRLIGSWDPLDGTTWDSFTIDSPQNSSNWISLIFGATNDERLEYSLVQDQFYLTDDLSVLGNLTVTGLATLDSGIDVNNSIFTVSPAGTVYMQGNLSAGGNAAFAGDVDLGDADTDTISLFGNIDTDLTFINDTTFTTEAGDFTLDPAGDINLGVNANTDTILSGDLTIQGNDVYSSTNLVLTFLGADVTMGGNVAILGTDGLTFSQPSADIAFANGEYIRNESLGTIGIGADVSISGDLTVLGSGESRITNGRLVIGTGTPSDFSDDAGDVFITEDLEVQRDISLNGALSFGGLLTNLGSGVTIQDDVTITGVTFLDEIWNESDSYININSEVAFGDNVTISGSNLYTSDNFLINPVQGAKGNLYLGVLAEGDSVIVAGDLTVFGNLSVAAVVPTLDIWGTTADTFTIDTDDSSLIPTLIFEHSTGNVYLRWEETLNEFHLSNDLSIGGALTVALPLRVDSSGVSQFVNGHVQIGPGTHTGIGDDDGDLYVVGDIEIGGDLSIGGDTTIVGVIFGDDGTTILGDLTVTDRLFVDAILDEADNALTIGNNAQTVSFNTSDWDISTTGDMSDFGNITMDGVLYLTQNAGLALQVYGDTYLGNASGDDHYIRGTTVFGLAESLTITDTGDLSVGGDTSLGDQTTDTFELISSGLNISSVGDIYDANGAVMIQDSLSVSSEISVSDEMYIYGTNPSRIVNGSLRVGNGTPSDISDDPGDIYVSQDVEIEGSLSVGANLTLTGAFHGLGGLYIDDDVTITQTLYVDYIDKESEDWITIVDDVYFNRDITVGGGNIFSTGDFTLNPDQDGGATLYLGEPGQDDLVVVYGTLTTSGDLTVDGVIYGTAAIDGTIQPTFTIDMSDLSDRPTLYLYDSNGSEYLAWNDPHQVLELSDDLSIDGGMTLYGDLVVEGGPVNVSYFNGSDTTVQITDGNLEIYGDSDGESHAPTTGFDDDGDVYVEGDVEIVGDLSLGGDTTIGGIIFSDDYIQIQGPLTVMGDVDVRGMLYDGIEGVLNVRGDLSISDNLSVIDSIFIGLDDAQDDYLRFAGNTEAFFWDESEGNFNLTDDLSIKGDLTVDGSSFLGNENTDQFTVNSSGLNVGLSGVLYDYDSALYINDDVSVAGELSIGGPLIVQSTSTSQFTGADATVEISDGHLNILGSSDSTVASTNFQDDGDLFVEDSIEVGGDVSVGTTLTVLGNVEFGDDYTDLFMVSSSGLNVSWTGAMYDYDSQLVLNDDISVLGELSVNDGLYVVGSGLSQFINGHVQIGPGTHTGIADDDGDLYVVGDVEIGGDLSIGGDTTIAGVLFGDDYTQISGNLTVNGDLDIRGFMYDGLGGVLDIKDNLSVEKHLTVSTGSLFIGYDDATNDTVYFGGGESMYWDETANEFYFTDDVKVANDITVTGGDIIGPSSATINLGEEQAGAVTMKDDVSISGALTVGDTIFIGNAIKNVSYNVIDSDGVFNPSGLMNDANDLYVAGDIEIGGNLSMGGDTTIVGVIFSDEGTIVMDDLTVRGGLFVDSIDDEIGGGISITAPVTFNQDLTLNNGSLFSTNDLLINPDQDGSGTLSLGGANQGDEIYINGDTTVNGSMTVSGDFTASGVIYGNFAITGTIADFFTIDVDDNSDIPTLYFEDSDGDEFLRWDDTQSSFQLSDDLSIDGGLTVYGDLSVSGGSVNASYFSGSDTLVEITDGRMMILESSTSNAPSSGFDDDGDLFVEDDVEIAGVLSIGGDTTIAGVIFGDDFTQIQGDLTVTRDIYAGRNTILAGEIDINGTGLNDIEGYMNVGSITTEGGSNPGALAISENLTIVGGNIDSPTAPLKLNTGKGNNQPVFIGTTTHTGIADEGGDLYLTDDLEILGDLSITGNATIASVIFTDSYIQVMGSLTVGKHLDVRGNILDGLEDDVDFVDDVSITGGLSTTESIRVGRDGTGTFAVGGSVIQAYNVIGNSGDTADGSLDDNDLFISGSVEINEQIDIDGAGLNDLEGYLNLGAINAGEGGSNVGALAISEDLTIVGGNIDVPSEALKLNAGTGSNQPVFIGVSSHTGIADEGGDLYVSEDLEILGDLSIGGDTTIAGVVFGDDHTQIMGSLTITEHLDVRGNIFDGLADDVDVTDNLSVALDVTVNNSLAVLGSGMSEIRNGRLMIGQRSPSIAGDAGELYVSGDTEIWGDLSIGGDTTIAGVIFSDDATEIIGELTVHGHVYPSDDDTYDLGSASAEWRDLYIDGTANIDSLIADSVDIDGGTIDNTVIGDTTPARATFTNLSVTGNTELGTDAADNILLNAEFISNIIPDGDGAYDLGSGAQGWRDLYLAAQKEIIWNDTERFTFDGANFTLSDDLSLEGVLNVDGTGASVIDGYLNIVSTGGQNPGDLALGGDLTVEDGARIGADGTGTIAIGGASVEAYNVIGDSGASADNLAVSTDDDLLIEGTVEIDEQIDIDGTGLNDLEGYLNLGAVDGGEGGTSQGALAISEDLTILGGNIDSSAEPLKLNIGKGSSQPVFIGATTHVGIADEGGDLFVANDIEVRGDLSIGGSTTIAGVVFGDDYTLIAGDLTVEQDVYVGRNTIVTGELDINGTGLNDIEGYVEVGNITTQGGSQPGAVAIGEDLTVVGGNIDVSTEALKLNAGKGSSQPVFIGATSHTGIADEGGDLYVLNDVEIGGQLSVSGDTTVGGVLFSNDYLRINGSLTVDENIDIRGNILDGLADDVDIKDNLSIDGDLTVFGSTKLGDSTNDGFELISSGLNVDINGVISDAGSQLIVDEDVSVTGELSVNNTLTVNGSGLSQFVNGHVQIGPGSHTGIADDDGDLYVINDVEIGGDLSIGGDTTIGGVLFTNNYLRIQGSLTVDDHVDIRGNILDGIEDDVDLQDNLSIDGDLTVFGSTKLGDSTSDGFEVVSSGLNVDSSGVVSDSSSEFIVNDDVSVAGELSVNDTLTVDGSGLSQFVNGHVQIGAGSHTGIADDDGDLYVVGDVEIRGDLSIGGDTSIAGVVFGDDYTEITGSLSVTENLDLGGYLYDSGDDVIEIRGDLSIQGNTTIAGVIFSDEYTQIEGHLTVGDDLDVRGNIFDGAGDIVEILDDVSIDGYLSVAGQIYPTIMPGTASAEFSIDVEDTTATPTLKFTDATQDETLLWNDNANRQTFELSDDLSILGELTVTNNVISFGNGASINNDNTSDVLDINSTYIAFSNDVTIGGDLTILGNGVTQIPNGRVTVGDDSGNLYAYGPGDLFVAGDAQIVGGVYAATLTGAIEADGTTEPYFVIDQGSIAETADVALYFSDDGDDYAHYIKWADSEEYVAISDDATINGNLTVKSNMLIEGSGASKITSGRVEIGSGSPSSVSDDAGDLYVTNDVEIGGTLSIGGDVTIVGVIFGDDYTQIMNNLTLEDDLDVRGRILDGAGTDVDVFDDLSISGNLTTYGGDIKGVGVTNIDLGEENTGVITMTGDVSVSGDVTISGDLSVAGEILGVPDTYVDVVGDTMTGTLYINTPAALALDIDGDIEYTGHLKNKSPVKFQDGINIVNLGGISGGQILGRDVIIALKDNISVTRDTTRKVFVPTVKFVRYTKKTPEIKLKKELIVPDAGYLQLSLNNNQHVIAIQEIGNGKFIRNVGLDGALSEEGDYKLGTTNKITYLIEVLDLSNEIEVTYTIREDIDQRNYIEHSVGDEEIALDEGWVVVYIEEIALDEISAHDSAAMSPTTALKLRVDSFDEYDYSADRYVVAIIADDDKVVQSIRISRGE